MKRADAFLLAIDLLNLIAPELSSTRVTLERLLTLLAEQTGTIGCQYQAWFRPARLHRAVIESFAFVDENDLIEGRFNLTKAAIARLEQRGIPEIREQLHHAGLEHQEDILLRLRGLPDVDMQI